MDVEEAYRILGVSPGAGAKEVQRAYRRKALESHPDRASSAEEAELLTRTFLRVRDAYERLRKEGFPVPRSEEIIEEVRLEVPPGGWTAGRRFTPKPGEEPKMGTAEKLGFRFDPDVGTVFLWGIIIPGGAVGAYLFVRYMLRLIAAGE